MQYKKNCFSFLGGLQTSVCEECNNIDADYESFMLKSVYLFVNGHLLK